MVQMSHRASHRPSALSGGEQQRVAIARALANSPSVVLADEPTGNLDTATRDDIQRLFFDLRERTNQTFIIVTHDEHLAQMSDRKIVMSDGTIK
jgi:lipoprotein-releasing system ATP-binding protein